MEPKDNLRLSDIQWRRKRPKYPSLWNQAVSEWHQEDPNELIVKDARAPRKVYRRGNGYITGAACQYTHPFGHPEGFIEAFANVYNAAAEAIHDEVSESIPARTGMTIQTSETDSSVWPLLKRLLKAQRPKRVD